MKKYENWKKYFNEFQKVKKWMDLPHGKRYAKTDTFEISIAHCSINIVRVGQQYQGSENYHNSPSLLNESLLELIKTDSTILERAVKLCHKKERQAFFDSREEVENILKEINAEDENQDGM